MKYEHNFEDYSFSQTTLEQVFIKFAKQQEEADKVARGFSVAVCSAIVLRCFEFHQRRQILEQSLYDADESGFKHAPGQRPPKQARRIEGAA